MKASSLINKKILLALWILLCASKSFAYKVELHALMTEQAALRSVLADNSIWEEWGYSDGSQTLLAVPMRRPESLTNWIDWQDQDGNIRDGIAFSYARLMSFGSDIEDTNLDVTAHIWTPLTGMVEMKSASSRAFNHFFNPQANQKLPLVGVIQDNHTSPSWILEDEGISIPDQNYSYSDAQAHFFDSFRLPSAASRQQSLGMTLYTLGHVVHHVQDMAQPQHTRLDMHCDAEACKTFDKIIRGDDDTSVYEVFTQNLINCEAYAVDYVEEYKLCSAEDFDEWRSSWSIKKINVWGYPVVDAQALAGTNAKPRDFWTNIKGSGIADFSSKNFISTDTAFGYSRQNCPAGGCSSLIDYLAPFSVSLPFPNGEARIGSNDGTYTETYVGESKKLSELVTNTADFSQSFLDTKIQFLGMRFFDKYSGLLVDNPKAASYSIFHERLEKKYSVSGQHRHGKGPARFTVNYFNLQEQANILIPRAVGYSSGLINFFFRYRFKISENRHFQQLSTWSVKNLSEYPFHGEIVFYYDDINGVRHPVPTQPGKVSIMPGKSIDIGALVVPPSAKPSQNFYAVAVEHRDNRALALGGVKFTNINRNAKEPEPCDKTIEVAGGSETIRTLINLGESNGVVKITYNMFNIPDSIFIAKLDGTSLYTTWSPVSGSSTISIDYDSSQFPQQAIYLTIVGNRDQGTQWTVRASCPR